MSAQSRWTDAELLSCLRFAAGELGGVLTAERFTEFGRRRLMPDGRAWPTAQAIQIRWTRWNLALVDAGLPFNPPSAITGNTLFTDEDMLDAVRAVRNELGHNPSVAEYERAAQASHGGLPSASLIRKRKSLGGKWSSVIARL